MGIASRGTEPSVQGGDYRSDLFFCPDESRSNRIASEPDRDMIRGGEGLRDEMGFPLRAGMNPAPTGPIDAVARQGTRRKATMRVMSFGIELERARVRQSINFRGFSAGAKSVQRLNYPVF